jgi:nucleoside-diphosphate-sugar epimerase
MLNTRMETPFCSLPRMDLDHVLEHAGPAWQALRGARLFMTGGTGLFGLWLLESIAAANARLGAGITATVLSRDPEDFRVRAPQLCALPFLQFKAGDVRTFEFPKSAHDFVIHAAVSTNSEYHAAQPEDVYGTIVNGTRRALEFAASAGARDLLFISSGAVYGPQPPTLERIPETYPAADPATAYARGKRAAEQLCEHAIHPGALRAKIARCFAFVGPHLPLDAHFAVGNFLRDSLAGTDIVVSGDGTPYRSYLHLADLVVWLLTILTKGAPSRIYNVGSDEALPISDLAARVARLPPSRPRVQVRKRPGNALPERYVPSIDRARRELGLQVGIPLDDALARTHRWLRSGTA